MKNKKKAIASPEMMRKVFTLPVDQHSTLFQVEKEISQNLHEFLNKKIVVSSDTIEEISKTFASTKIPDEPTFVNEYTDFIMEELVPRSVNTSSPSFLGHMTSAIPYFMLPMAKIMTALNQNLVKIETSKAFTPLERQVTAMLHRLIFNKTDNFYKDTTHDSQKILGTFCSGGTVANITGIWAARNKAFAADDHFEGIQKKGLIASLKHYKYDGMAVLVSKRGHYSLLKSADLLGFGHDELIQVNTDENHRCDLTDLQTKIENCKNRNIKVIAVIGIAGSTETGSVDPLSKMAEICSQEKIHFHVDAAWGGPTLFSSTNRELLKGIELADSVCFDAHKQLYVPMGVGMVLFKDPNHLSYVQHSAQYIIRRGSMDLGKHTLEGSRPGMALLVHSALHVIGKKGYELLIDSGIKRAQIFAKLIEENSNFEVITQPHLNILTYRFVPSQLQQLIYKTDKNTCEKINLFLNELTVLIQKEQRAVGKTFVSRTQFEVGRYSNQNLSVFRAVLANPLTTKEHLKSTLAEQSKIAENILNSKLKGIYDDLLGQTSSQ